MFVRFLFRGLCAVMLMAGCKETLSRDLLVYNVWCVPTM